MKTILTLIKRSCFPIIISLIVGFLLQSQFLYPQSNWKQFRIHGGFSRFACLSTNPHEAGILYATSPGHVHRSADAGVSWQSTTYANLVSFLESILVFDRTDPDRCFIIKKPVGLLHTTDRGKSFSWINDGLGLSDSNRTFTYFNSLSQNPYNSNEFLLSGNGLYRSTDRGTHWQKIKSGQTFEHILYDVTIKDHVYSTYSSGGFGSKDYFLKSTNNGVDWQFTEINVDGYYPLYQLPNGTIYLGNLFSTDRGTTWRKIKPASPGADNEAKGDFIVQYVYDEKHQLIYAVDQSKGLLKLKAGDDTWELTPFSLNRNRFISHTARPATNAAIDTLNDRLYVVSSDSLFVSEKGGEFHSVQTHLYYPLVNQLSFKGSDTILAVVPRVGRSAISINRGNHWEDIRWYHDITSAAYLPFGNFLLISRDFYPMCYSFDQGNTFNQWKLYTWATRNERMKINPLDPIKIFGHGNEGLFYVTKDNVLDTSLKSLPNHLTADSILGWILDFDFHPTISRIYYVVSQEPPTYSSNVYKTTNGGTDWIKLTNNVGLDSVYRAIALDPNNPNRIYVATDWGIIYSHDDGMTWNKGRGPMPNSSFGQSEWFTGIVVDPRASNIIYASARSIPRQHPPESTCSGGVWRSKDSGATWQPMSMEGLLNVSVNWLQYKDNPPRLIACTMGGAYEYLLPDPVSVKTEIEPPGGFELSSVYPNPVSKHRSFVVRYRLPKEDFVEIKMLDVFGREVKTLASGFAEAGEHQLHQSAHMLCAGIYFIRMQTRNFGAMKKICLVSDR